MTKHVSMQTFFTSPMGKTAIDEQHSQFGGIYVGELTKPDVREAVESADFTLYVGALKSDFNTGSFSWHISPEDTVELHSDYTQVQVSPVPIEQIVALLMHTRLFVQYAMYPDAGFQSLLPKLIPEMAKIASSKSSSQKVAVPKNAGLTPPPAGSPTDEPLKQDTFVRGHFLQRNIQAILCSPYFDDLVVHVDRFLQGWGCSLSRYRNVKLRYIGYPIPF